MPSKKKLVDPSLLPSMLAQLFVIVMLTVVFSYAGLENALFIALIIYLSLAFLLKRVVPINQTKGVALVKAGNIEGALEQFQKSYQFFSKYPLLDKYRAFFLLTVNTLSYTEMALLNVAYCQDILGDKKKAEETYEEVLKQFPKSLRAKAALQKYQPALDEDQGLST